MKKMTILLIVVAMMLMSAGCSMFAGKDGDGKGEDSQAAADAGVSITDTFTHEDPEDIEFDERHVLYFPAGCDYLSVFEQEPGVKPTDCYIIIYANEKKVVASYEYTVCEDEEAAKMVGDFYTGAGLENTTEGNVNYFIKKQDALDAEIAQWIAMSAMDDETIDSYLDFYIGSFAPVIKE